MSRHTAPVRYARIAAVLLPLAAACSSSATDPSNRGARPLSADEAGLVESAVRQEAYSALGTTGAHVAVDAAPQTFTAPCPFGGSVALALTSARTVDAAGAGYATSTTTFTPRACRVSAGARNVTVDGDTALVAILATPIVNGAVSSTAPVVTRTTGGLKIDGARCAVDYTVTTTSGKSLTTRGTICGYAVP